MKKILSILFLLLVGLSLFAVPVFAEDAITGSGHIQDIGWKDYPNDGSHLMLGTVGQAKRVEAVTLTSKIPGVGVTYQTHVQNVGWQDWVSDGRMAGTEGKALRVEAIRINLTGENAANYSLYYRAHVENYGWLDWATAGQTAGTSGHSYRCEAFELVILPAGSAAPGNAVTPAIEATTAQEATHMYLVNRLRKNYGLNYVTGNASLKALADARVQELPSSFSHTRPNGKSFDTIVKDVYPRYPQNAAGLKENIIFGKLSISDPTVAFGVYLAYPHDVDNTILDPYAKYMSWSSTIRGSMAYSVELFSGIDQIDFANY